jgi:hypothetical protein
MVTMRSRSAIFAAVLAVAFLGSGSGLASIDSTAGEANMSPMSTAAPRVCHIEGSMYVGDSPTHPYRVGVTRVGDNCEVTEGYEDLSAKQFGALTAEARDEAGVTIAPLPVTALSGSPDAILAATSTQKIRGYHHGQHLGVKMVEVRSELRWWYNGVSVTSYGEGLCGRWAGDCWNFAGGGLGCWWEALGTATTFICRRDVTRT